MDQDARKIAYRHTPSSVLARPDHVHHVLQELMAHLVGAPCWDQHTLTPNTVELIHILGVLRTRGGSVYGALGQHPTPRVY